MSWLTRATEKLASAMRPLPTSSYGYPVRPPTPSEQAFFALNPNVGGYAAEDRSIVLNEGARNEDRYLSNRELGAVAQNEAARLYMRDRGIVPDFKLTKEQEQKFQGTAYASNPEALKQSIAARIITGDQSAGKITKEQKSFSQGLLKQMQGIGESARPNPESKLGNSIMQTQADIASSYLRNWYERRKITDPYIQEALTMDKPEVMRNLKTKQYVQVVPSIGGDPRITGSYEKSTGSIKFTPTTQIDVPLHEMTHYATQAGPEGGGSYMRTIHKDIVKNELKPQSKQTGVYKDKFEYFSDPDEVHARIMVLRKRAGFKPDQVVTEKDLNNFLEKYQGESENINDLLNMSRGKRGVLNMLNFMAKSNSPKNTVV